MAHGTRWDQIDPSERHGAGPQAQSSDGTGSDGHLGKFASGVLTDNGNADCYATDSGAANAYAIALSPAITITTGDEIRFKAANSNTGASTLALNGGSTIAIKKQGSTTLASGDITAGQIVVVVYDGTNWQLVGGGNLVAGSSGGGGTGTSISEVPTGTLDGSNKDFAITHSPAGSGTLKSMHFYLNGVVQDSNWISLSAGTATFTVAPTNADQVFTEYEY